MCVFATRVSKQSDDTREQTQTSNTLRNTRIAAATLQHARQAWQQQRRASRLAACSREQITHRRTVSTMKLELPDVNREHADLRNLAHAKVPLICASRPNRACVEQYVAANGVETKQQCTQRSTTIDSPLLRALQTQTMPAFISTLSISGRISPSAVVKLLQRLLHLEASSAGPRASAHSRLLVEKSSELGGRLCARAPWPLTMRVQTRWTRSRNLWSDRPWRRSRLRNATLRTQSKQRQLGEVTNRE